MYPSIQWGRQGVCTQECNEPVCGLGGGGGVYLIMQWGRQGGMYIPQCNRAGGTHPIGMHSSLDSIFHLNQIKTWLLILNQRKLEIRK